MATSTASVRLRRRPGSSARRRRVRRAAAAHDVRLRSETFGAMGESRSPRRKDAEHMKKVEAVIRPEMLPVVRKALEEIGIKGVTITQVLGHGAQRGVTQQ